MWQTSKYNCTKYTHLIKVSNDLLILVKTYVL